ncbi:hypothetical protein CBM2585_B50411 [Cupriavidus taiwanensis]|nr:hypothetical protein CBM2585_B50411 [Cupriavidus taiwanensis]
MRPGKDPASLFGSAEFPGDDAGAHPLMRYFVDTPARSPAPLPQAEEKTSGRGKSRRIASDNACERSDALRARAADLR